MPRKKHWFPFNQDFNDDGELWEFTDLFGDRALRAWMQICSILDKSENRFVGSEANFRAVFRKARIYPKNGWGMVRFWIEKRWLAVPEKMTQKPPTNIQQTSNKPLGKDLLDISSSQPLVFGSPNYWKYHPKVEAEKFLSACLLPSFLPDSSLKKEKNPEPPPSAGSLKTTPTRSETEKPRSDFEPLLQFAVKIAGGDPGAQQKLCQWTMSMIAFMKADPKERTLAVVKSSLETLKAKIDAGYQITSLWGLLTTIFNQERTKYIQGPEHAAYKQPIAVPADINKLMKGIG